MRVFGIIVTLYCLIHPLLSAQDRSEAIENNSELSVEAKGGDPLAQFHLAERYSENRENERAFKWYRASAEQGNLNAQFQLGAAYWAGLGVARDFNQAAAWFRKAAKRGDPRAERRLISALKRLICAEEMDLSG